MENSEPGGATDNMRHISLDALRGFAVMGILAMNITAFSMPFMAYLDPAIYGGDSGANLASWYFSYILFDGKMRGIFSLLFGASMMLIIDRTQAKGESPARTHYARMFWLACFGLAHFFFIWFGDILFLYAVIGCIAFAFRNWVPHRLVKWALIINIGGSLLFSVGMGGMIYVQHRANSPTATAEETKNYQNIMENPDFSAAGTRQQLDVYRGNYTDIVAHKIREEWYDPLTTIMQSIFETLPMMLIGMALLKNGFLLGEWDRGIYRKWAIYGISGGVIFGALSAWAQTSSNFNIIIILNSQIAWMMLPRMLMTMGYVAALILLIQHMAGGALLTRIAATGRAAFTNYLGTSILMTTIFYGYGLNLFGQISRIQTWPFVIGAWIIMLIWSKPWLEKYRYGPLEWLWRSLARMKVQPFRR